MHPWSGPRVLGWRLCFGLDCAQSTTFAVRWHHETGGAADKDRHRHQGLCSRCCYCMEQTTSWHSNLNVHGSDITQKLKTFYASWRIWGLFILRGRNWLIIIIIIIKRRRMSPRSTRQTGSQRRLGGNARSFPSRFYWLFLGKNVSASVHVQPSIVKSWIVVVLSWEGTSFSQLILYCYCCIVSCGSLVSSRNVYCSIVLISIV